MLTVILAVIAGFIATAILVMVTTTISAKVMGCPTTPGVAPPTSFSLVSLALGLASAAAGGWVAQAIATGNAPLYLAGLIFVMGVFTAVSTPADQRRGQPGWYLYLLPVVGAVGALLGGGVIP
jgi:hypothetical protein